MADEARVRKVQDRIQETVASLLGRRIKDPRLGFVTITDVRVTGDLQHASIFYTVLGNEDDRAGTARAFESAKGLIRSEVGKALGSLLAWSLFRMLCQRRWPHSRPHSHQRVHTMKRFRVLLSVQAMLAMRTPIARLMTKKTSRTSFNVCSFGELGAFDR